MPDHKRTWESLNERQQKYMLAIYQIDQANEAYERSEAAKGNFFRPRADVWRWIFHGSYISPVAGKNDSELKAALRRLGMLDEGTGSTYAALEKRGLINTMDNLKHIFDERQIGLVDGWYAIVQITRKGRAVVRASMPDYKPRPRTAPKPKPVPPPLPEISKMLREARGERGLREFAGMLAAAGIDVSIAMLARVEGGKDYSNDPERHQIIARILEYISQR